MHNIRAKGKSCFIVLRDGFYTLQTLIFKSEEIELEMIKYLSDIPNESVVDIVGVVKKP